MRNNTQNTTRKKNIRNTHTPPAKQNICNNAEMGELCEIVSKGLKKGKRILMQEVFKHG